MSIRKFVNEIIDFVRAFVENRNSQPQVSYKNRSFFSKFVEKTLTYFFIPFCILQLLLKNLPLETFFFYVSFNGIQMKIVLSFDTLSMILSCIFLIWSKYFNLKFIKSLIFFVVIIILNVVGDNIDLSMKKLLIYKSIQYLTFLLFLLAYPRWCLNVYSDRNLTNDNSKNLTE